jgi:hypothetical protein
MMTTVCHGQSFSQRFSPGFGRRFAPKVCFDFLQCDNAFAFEIAPAGLGRQWFRHKTILNTQRIMHCRPEIFLNL